ncbi:hypothetical protein QF031_003158 [Pseudarthrobacter defluvii]|uniref:hypothetical protein n=1 Tax=Pseudarthrobacter defluvii TaxID=410837 RepID=UPI0027882160|nr:hypothetical protein [Pseudarthrobacter defluvii]MDQ0770409.1 hypothetical protein [Pseudarthrobacter defluvii]
MLTKRTTVIGTALALGAAAFAAPAQAASSNGADVSKFNECTPYSEVRTCSSGIVVSNHVSTPSGNESTSSSSNYTDTLTSNDGSTSATISTQTHTHILVRDGQVFEMGQHYREQSTFTSPDGTRQCWEREDSHQVRGSVQYDREAHYCP